MATRERESREVQVEPNGDRRIDMFKTAGWEVVENPNIVVGDVVDGSRDASLGGTPMVIIDKSTGRKGVVMRTLRSLYEADQQDKQKKITDDENRLLRRKRNPNESTEDGDYGEVKLSK